MCLVLREEVGRTMAAKWQSPRVIFRGQFVEPLIERLLERLGDLGQELLQRQLGAGKSSCLDSANMEAGILE